MTKPPAPGQIETWANNCAVYEVQNRAEGNEKGAEYHRGAKEAYQRVAALAAQPVAPPGASTRYFRGDGVEEFPTFPPILFDPTLNAADRGCEIDNDPRPAYNTATPANPDVREDDMPLSQTSWAEHQKVCAYCADGKPDCNRGRKLFANLCDHPDCDNQRPCPIHKGNENAPNPMREPVTNLSQQDYDNLVRDAMKWRKQSIDADKSVRESSRELADPLIMAKAIRDTFLEDVEKCDAEYRLLAVKDYLVGQIDAHVTREVNAARLDEAKWWASKMPRMTLYEPCGGPQRIAALEKLPGGEK